MIGRTLTNYRVVSQLGAGGMGEVYKAVDLRLDRTVALKVLPPDKSGDAERRARFLQEARSASALNDPHIVTIHDIFTEDGTDVLVMEYVHGQTLRDVINSGPLRVGDALDYTLQAAEGIGTAHAAGIVHRDLKPGNIMVTERGRVKVLDFGLAKLTRTNDDQMTVSGPSSVVGGLLGTIDYMSPEQARGEAVDHRSDVFSLGCVLYELLTGERPFQASHPLGVLHEIIFGVIRPPRDRRPEVSADLDAIVLRALERDITRRYQSMEALISDLRLAQRRLNDASAQTATSFLPPPIPIQPPPIESPSASTAPASAAPASTLPMPAAASSPAIAAATGAAAVVGPIAAWAKSMSRRPRRRPRSLLSVLPFVAAVLFAAPITRGWILDQVGKLGAGRTDSAAGAPATASTPATPYEMTQQGLALLKRFDRPGNIDAAVDLFERAIAMDEKYAPAQAGMARALVRRADETRDKSWSSRAVDAARFAVTLDSYLAEAHSALAAALVAAGNPQDAEVAARRAVSLDPGNGPAYFVLGDIAYGQDSRDAAVEAYQKALELMPGNWEPAVAIGTVAYRNARYDDAIDWYRRAIALAPDVAAPQWVLGSAQSMKGDYAAAATTFQKAISIQPTASAYSNLGTALFMDGRYRESVAAFEKGVESRPSDPLMWGNLGDAYRATAGGREKAGAAYERAIQLLEQQLVRDSSNVRDRSRLALYLAKHDRAAQAISQVTAISALADRDANTLYRAAVTYEVTGNRDTAIRWLSVALEKGYSMKDVTADPELAGLRGDVRYHRLAERFERRPNR